MSAMRSISEQEFLARETALRLALDYPVGPAIRAMAVQGDPTIARAEEFLQFLLGKPSLTQLEAARKDAA